MNSLKNLKNQFAAVLTRDEMKNVVGGVLPPSSDGPCGVKVNGVWMEVNDSNGNGTTKEEAIVIFDSGYAYYQGENHPVSAWCCESCPWN